MASTSSLPPQPAAASAAAVDSALANTEAKDASSSIPASTSSQSVDTNASSADADTSIRTVFSDPENFNVKHPLFHTWTLWFDNPSAAAKGGAPPSKGGKDSWGEEMNKVVTFDSVEEFWGLYNNIIPPSELPQKANYYLFKEGIQPAWEDPANTDGGKWSIQLPRDRNRASIDQLWLYTMLSAIGETLESPYGVAKADFSSIPPPEVITGVIMSARPNFYRLAIWTRHAEEDAATGDLDSRLLDIGKHFKADILGQQLGSKIGGGLQTDVEFQSHKDSEKKGKGKKYLV